MLSQTSLSQISMYAKIFIPMKIFKREFNNKFNNSIIAVKLRRRQIKDCRYLQADTESHIDSLRFFVKILEKYF